MSQINAYKPTNGTITNTSGADADASNTNKYVYLKTVLHLPIV